MSITQPGLGQPGLGRSPLWQPRTNPGHERRLRQPGYRHSRGIPRRSDAGAPGWSPAPRPGRVQTDPFGAAPAECQPTETDAPNGRVFARRSASCQADVSTLRDALRGPSDDAGPAPGNSPRVSSPRRRIRPVPAWRAGWRARRSPWLTPGASPEGASSATGHSHARRDTRPRLPCALRRRQLRRQARADSVSAYPGRQ